MDTSETYIKMCDCEEIQEKWMLKYGDWVGIWSYPRPGVCEISQTHIVMDRYPSLMRTLSGFELCQSECLWLPRQDQIQEIFGEVANLRHFSGLIEGFFRFSATGYGVEQKTFEQLWLAFYMYEKHSKEWTGKKWVKKNA